MPSVARDVYDRLNADVGNLLDYHPTVASPGAGRPPGDTAPLLRSTVVLIHTAWENYVEQVVLEAVLQLLQAVGDDHGRLPAGLRRAVADQAKAGNPWDVAGDGWKHMVEHHVRRKIDRLNTPNSENVETLCRDFLGLPSVLDGCGWQNKTAQAVRGDLDSLVHDVRGEIVHKGRTATPLGLRGVQSWRDFVGRLVERFDAHVAAEFESAHGARPWPT